MSGVDTHTRADDGRRRSSDGSILDSGDISRYTKRSVEDQWKEKDSLILFLSNQPTTAITLQNFTNFMSNQHNISKNSWFNRKTVKSPNNCYHFANFHKLYVKSMK